MIGIAMMDNGKVTIKKPGDAAPNVPTGRMRLFSIAGEFVLAPKSLPIKDVVRWFEKETGMYGDSWQIISWTDKHLKNRTFLELVNAQEITKLKKPRIIYFD